MKRRLLLVDFLNLAFRAYYSPGPELNAPNGVPTGAVHRFISMTQALIAHSRATHVAFAFDSEGPTFRADLFDGYKKGRAETPEGFDEAISLMNRAAGRLGYARYRAEGFEADDVLAALAVQAAALDFHVFIGTGDKDLFGTVSEHTTMLWTAQGMGKIAVNTFGPDEVEAKFGVRPERFADLKALVGDHSDRIPGCPKVGEAIGPWLIQTFGSFSALYEALHAWVDRSVETYGPSLVETIPSRYHKALLAGEETARLSLVLATLRLDAPVTLDQDAGRQGADDRATCLAFLQHYGLAVAERRLPPVAA